MEIKYSKEVLELIPARKAFESNVLPIELSGDCLKIAVSNKSNQQLLSELSFYTGHKVEPVEYPADILLKNIRNAYGKEVISKEDKSRSLNESLLNENTIIEFVNQLINNAIKSNCSDLHFEVYESSARVRYRVDGRLREVLNITKAKMIPLISRLKIMSNMDISEKRRPQDGGIRHIYEGNNIDIRVSSIPGLFGEKMVLRILDKSNFKLDLRHLGLDDTQFGLFSKAIKLPYGMILVTGPTGSGKTTSLYSALQYIISEERNILTIEDPIEYHINGINQSSVKHDIGYDFANALRAFLRQDPDVIMVGEIRDKETAEIAIRASLTGHLVFSTLHTNDSISAITRLVDMGVEPFLVASSIKLIIAQRLVRKMCKCKTSVNGQSNKLDKFSPNGCDECSYTGFKGRTALFEMFEIDENISELISSNASIRQIREAVKQSGFKTLREAGIEKVKEGITTYDEVLYETMV